MIEFTLLIDENARILLSVGGTDQKIKMRSSPSILMVADDSEDVFLTRRALKVHLGMGVSASLPILSKHARCLVSMLATIHRMQQGQQGKPDLIILDLNMPGISGVDLLTRRPALGARPLSFSPELRTRKILIWFMHWVPIHICKNLNPV